MTDQIPVATPQDAPQGDLIRCANPSCTELIRRVVAGSVQRKACSDRCRTAAWDLAHPRKRPQLTTQQQREAAARKPSSVGVLERLRRGPATTSDLLNVYWIDRKGNPRVGCAKYGARVNDLRQAGYVIECKKLNESSALYTLVLEPSGYL